MVEMRITRAALAAALLLAGAVTAQSSGGTTSSLLWKQCDEDIIKLYLDPAPFQELVSPGYSVRLFDERAWVLVLAQDCPQYWFDGEEIGATREVHMWVAIEGPEDVRPVVGAQHTMPTMTWFNLFTGSDNARARKTWTSSGTPSVGIEALALDPPGPERGGRVLLGPDQSYSWQVASEAPSVRLIGVNHDVYGTDGSGKIVLNRIQALVNGVGYDSPGSLEVVGGMGRENFIGAGTYEVEVHSFFPVWAQASLGEVPTISPFSYVRVFADEEGESHFEDAGLDLTNVDLGGGVSVAASAMRDLVGVTFFCFADGTRVDWHPAPRRQFYFILSGQLELEVSDGERRQFQAGDVILGDATEGRGVRAQWRGSERACVGVAPVRASL